MDYKINNQLGYISLNQKLENDEILAVAFQFTVGNQVFQVGEFANDGVQATEVSVSQSNTIAVVRYYLFLIKDKFSTLIKLRV